MPLQRRWIGIAALAIAIGALFLPTTYSRILSQGTDTFESHRIFFGTREVSHEISIGPQTNGLGFILVNLKKKEPAPVEVTIFSTNGETLGRATIAVPDIQDDTFAWARLRSAITVPGNKVVVGLAAPKANATSPLGIRFDSITGQPALGVARQVPLWQFLQFWAQDNQNLVSHVRRLLSLALAVTTGLLGLHYGVRLEKNRLIIGCAVILLVAVAIRLPTLIEVKGVFGGDAFNYFLKSSAWIEGKDPFAADPRKGPLYALAVMPGLLTPDPLIWGKLATTTAAATASALLVILLATLTVPLPMALAGGLLLAVSRQMWWESVHSLANITFTALMVASLLVYVRAKPKKGEGYALGVVGALLTLTRYEGVLVPAILMPSFWIYARFHLKTLRQMILPFCIIMAIPFLFWPLSGEVGVRTWSDIESDGGLFLAHSFDDFQNNLKQYRLFIGRAWVLTATAGPQAAAVVVGSITSILFFLCGRRQPKALPSLQLVFGGLLFSAILAVVVANSADATKQLSLLFTYITGIGMGYLLISKPRIGVAWLLIFISQSLLVTWILPKDRYFIQLLPLMAVCIILGLFQAAGWHTAMKRNSLTLLLCSLLVSIVFWHSKHDINGLIDKYNEKAQETTVMLDVGRQLRPQPGNVAAAGDFLPMRVYLTDARLKVPHHIRQGQDVMAWLESEAIAYVVEFNFEPLFTPTVEAHGNRFELFRNMQANGYKASIYKLRP